MKAILCEAWGAPDTLRLAELPARAPGPGEVRIRVRAAGLNFADSLMIAGRYQVKPPLPFTPGLECAGEVVEAGPGVTHLAPGTRVLAVSRGGGAYAEELCVDARATVPIPDAMDFSTAASFPVAYGTSHLALTHRGSLKPGETLVVTGASGGVGLTAVEIGKALGARVIAIAGGPEKCEVARQYGADETIDHRSDDARARIRELTGGPGADVVYDTVGGDLFDACLRAVTWESRILVVGFASGRIPQVPANLILVKNVSVIGVVWGAQAERDPDRVSAQLTQLLGWWSEGRLKPLVSATFPLAEAGAALDALLSRKLSGKVVLEA